MAEVVGIGAASMTTIYGIVTTRLKTLNIHHLLPHHLLLQFFLSTLPNAVIVSDLYDSYDVQVKHICYTTK